MELTCDKRGVSPAISSVVITGALVILLLVAVNFANNNLESQISKNEFSAMKQIMQTIGLQVDDVAWISGRTQTIHYATRSGHVNFEPDVLNYTIFVDQGAGYVFLANYLTGVLLFNMPSTEYSLGNNHYELLSPSSDASFLKQSASAPITITYVIEKLPMTDGNYIRVVVAPSIRMLDSTIQTTVETENYFRFYLPNLSSGINNHQSTSITLTGKEVELKTEGDINAVKIQVSFPKTNLGFDKSFFNFDREIEEITAPDDSIIQFYTSNIEISLGTY